VNPELCIVVVCHTRKIPRSLKTQESRNERSNGATRFHPARGNSCRHRGRGDPDRAACVCPDWSQTYNLRAQTTFPRSEEHQRDLREGLSKPLREQLCRCSEAAQCD